MMKKRRSVKTVTVESNQTRIGFLVDGDPETDLMTALYEHDAIGVRVKVPYLVSSGDMRGRWWSQGVVYGDDPDRTKYDYSPPSELDYFDSRGSVGLIGCWSGPSTQKLGGWKPGVGVGVINARLALEGAIRASNYLKINGLRSEIDGLAHWLGYSALKTLIKLPKDGSAREISTSLTQVDQMPLGRALNLKAVAHGVSSGHQTAEVTYRSRVHLETFTKTARDWQEHLASHFGLRDLLRIAAWKPINFQSHQAASTKEAITVPGHERQAWRVVRTATTDISDAMWRSSDRFLFVFSDIGRTGLARWLRLADTYSRGIKPLVQLLDLEGATVDAHVAQLGIAVEAIGYQALIESGKSPSAANGHSVEKRIDYLLADVADTLNFDHTTFAKDFANTYNSVKHASRDVVAPALKVEHYRHGVAMLRSWVALRVGVQRSVLAT
jgi:hypothetical protein